MPQKDDKLLQDLIHKYVKLLAKHACRYGVPYSEAEGIAFDAIWAYYQSEYFDEKDEIQAKRIMTTIVKRRGIDYIRKEKKDDIVEVDIDDEDVYLQIAASEVYEPERVVVASEGYLRIIQVIERLKPTWRDVVKLYFLEERSYTEISEALGISEEVCRSRISRARKQLEKDLKDLLD